MLCSLKIFSDLLYLQNNEDELFDFDTESNLDEQEHYKMPKDEKSPTMLKINCGLHLLQIIIKHSFKENEFVESFFEKFIIIAKN